MKNDLSTMRHSAAHLLAAAVKKLYPQTSLGIGPVIEDGFYYDFDYPHGFSSQDFAKIEKEIASLKKKNLPFERIELSIADALKLTKRQKEPYKEELIDDLKKQGEKKVSFYKTGDFIDLCTGPHVKHSGQVGEVKLTSVAGAYWRGSEQNKMLQRIYGTAWFSKKELQEHLKNLEERKKRDHRVIGRELALFYFHETSPGMPYWLPKGVSLYRELLDFSRKIHKKAGYIEIISPALNKKALYVKSGHWKHYLEHMFISETNEPEIYGLKAMNCPNAMIVFASSSRSYKELPLRFFDTDTLHRNELSGTLSGLFRVREFRQDDAHVFVTQDQIKAEYKEILKLVEYFYSVFDLDYSFRLGTRPQKFMGDRKTWEKAQKELLEVLKESGKEFSILEGDGAFYGPKIDVLMKDSLGRVWQMGTIQLDFQIPKNFKLQYIDSAGKEKTPVTIHRAIYGSFERFLGILIEHFAGNFPIWLSPVQATIIPIAERHNEYAKNLKELLEKGGIRVNLDSRSETMQARVRDAQLQKTPYMLIVGDKERVAKSVSIRSRGQGDEGEANPQQFLQRLKQEIHELK